MRVVAFSVTLILATVACSDPILPSADGTLSPALTNTEIPSPYLINLTHYSLLVSHPANSARLEISQRRLTAFVNDPTMVLVEVGCANVADIGNSGQ